MLATKLQGPTLELGGYDAPATVLSEAVDTSKSRALQLDTRTYQELEPLRLPSKLRERISKAQRRAAAEKDGVSIFTTNASLLSLSGEDKDHQQQHAHTSSRPEAGDRKASTTISKRRDSQSQLHATQAGGLMAKEKMHLPDVILGHKMREFEAKMSSNALFVDPLENNLHHLTIEEKEKVMLKMQQKIQAITAQVDEHFLQLKEELDANGIFDSAANYQRAQALCLVELQKRCKLEKIRDDAMKEVLGEDGDGSEKTLSQMEGKLNELLAQKQREANQLDAMKTETTLEAARSMAMNHLQRTTKSSALKRRPGVPAAHKKRTLSPVKRQQQPSKHFSNQVDHDSNSFVDGEGASVGGTISAGVPAALATEDWASRHPHIAQVLQALNVLGETTPPPTESLDSFSSRGVPAEGTLDEDSVFSGGNGRFLTIAEEWAERSSSYQAIARRVIQELVERGSRWRWDSTKQFECDPVEEKLGVLPVDLLQRLRRRRETATARLREEDERLRQLQLKETNADKRKKADVVYQQLQETIQSKRQKAERNALLARTAARASTAGSRPHAVAVASSTRRAVTSEGVSRRHQGGTTTLTGVEPLVRNSDGYKRMALSASVPGLPTTDPAAPRPEERRPSFMEKKLPGLLSHSKSVRHHSRLRGDSRIGAPAFMDMTMLGHHSNSRIEERRSSAQTWAWLNPQRMSQLETGQVHDDGTGSRYEDDDSDVDASERRDAMGVVEEDGEDEDEDEDNEEDSDGASGSEDDARSIRSSVSSARSSFSVMSKAATHTHSASIPEHRSKNKSKTKASKSPKKRKGSRGRRSPSAATRKASSVRGPHGSHLSNRMSFSSSASGSSGGMFGNIHFTANAQVLQHRLEDIWRALEFPFSNRLLMLEKYADLSDSDAFARALEEWEAVVDIVMMREKLKHVLVEYEELKELKPSSRLTPADWSYLLMQQVEIPANAISLSAQDFVHWIHEHMDCITQRCEKMAQQLKAKTGDELTFQGQRYPPRV